MYAIVDIETTGGFAESHGITEVGVIISDGEKEVDRFETLINPNQHIPNAIEHLTGISNDMVEEAPHFHEIASALYKLLDGKIFVAHNVNFDYSFIKKAFKLVDIEFNAKRLCTVRYGRKVYPGLSSYRLENLCRHFEITNKAAHRAMGDTEATTTLLHKLLTLDENHEKLGVFLNARSREAMLPLHVNKADFENLPSSSGVYYFKGKEGNVLYVGKAKNIKKRVAQHFTGKQESKVKQAFKREVYHLDYIETGSELVAALYEDHEIRHLWPTYNKAQKKQLKKFAVVAFQDRLENWRIGVQQGKTIGHALVKFHEMYHARQWIFDQVESYGLNATFCDLPLMEHLGVEVEHEVHNRQVESLIADLNEERQSFVILEKGRTPSESAFILVEDDQYKGLGFVDEDIALNSIEEFRNYLELKKSSSTAQAIIEQHLSANKKTQISWFKK